MSMSMPASHKKKSVQKSGLQNGNQSTEPPFEPWLIRLSARLAGAQWHEVAAEVDAALREMLDCFALAQVGIFEVLAGNRQTYLRQLASASGQPSVPAAFSYGEWFPWAFQRVVLGAQVAASARAALPPEAAKDKASLETFGLHSMLHIPLHIEGEVRFVLAAAGRMGVSNWSERCVTRLTAVGEILAHAIARAHSVGALLASQRDVRDTLAVAHLGKWEWDIGADRLQLSDEAKHILGIEARDWGGLLRLVDAGDRAALEQSIAQARAEPGSRFKVRYSLHTPSGEKRVIQQWHEVLFPGERTERLLAAVQDLSALEGTEQEVTRLREHYWHSARVGQTGLLVASLAHELCQPLAAILNNAQAGLRFLKRGMGTPETMEEIFLDIVASNRKANEVLGALRAMLRRQTSVRVTFDAAEAVTDVLALVRSELMSEQIEVESALQCGCWVDADKTQIEQVVLNLVMNSIDAMRGESKHAHRLRLAVSAADDGSIEVAVQDSGSGIEPEQRPKVFEAFWTTKQKGLGMGLPLCRAIIESYGGRIWCEDNQSRGVTFRFKLPLAAAPLAQAAKIAAAGVRYDAPSAAGEVDARTQRAELAGDERQYGDSA